MTDAPRYTSKEAMVKFSPNPVFLHLGAKRTPIPSVKKQPDRARTNVTSNAVVGTTVMLAQPCTAAVSSC